MSSHESMADQFPFRPTGPDWGRLQEVIDWLEDHRAAGRTPEEVYRPLMDVYAASYVAVNRSGMDNSDKLVFTRKDMVDRASNAWMEGFLFGMEFQKRGGHRELGKLEDL